MDVSSDVIVMWYVSSRLNNALCQLSSTSCDNDATICWICSAFSRLAATAGHGWETQTHGFVVFNGCKWPSKQRKLYNVALDSATKPLSCNCARYAFEEKKNETKTKIQSLLIWGAAHTATTYAKMWFHIVEPCPCHMAFATCQAIQWSHTSPVFVGSTAAGWIIAYFAQRRIPLFLSHAINENKLVSIRQQPKHFYSKSHLIWHLAMDRLPTSRACSLARKNSQTL